MQLTLKTQRQPRIKFGYLNSVQTIDDKPTRQPIAYKLKVQDAASDVVGCFNFSTASNRRWATHAAIVLFGTDDKQIIVLKSLTENSKMILSAPAQTLIKRQFLRLDLTQFS